jgi:hypothetical protein
MKKIKRDIGTELCFAVAEANLEKLKELVAEGADVNAMSDRRALLVAERTPLWEAIKEAGSEISTVQKNWREAVRQVMPEIPPRDYVAKRESYVSIVKWLLEAGADVEKSCHGGKPIRIAVCGSDLEMVKLLLSHGASANAETLSMFSKLVPSGGAKITSGYYNAVLHEAVEKNSPQIVEALLEAGADFKRTDHEGKTALDIAREKGFSEIAKILEKCEAAT